MDEMEAFLRGMSLAGMAFFGTAAFGAPVKDVTARVSMSILRILLFFPGGSDLRVGRIYR